MLYRVLAGQHNEGNQTFKENEVFESALDLCTLFPNKFERYTPPVIVNTTPVAVPAPVAEQPPPAVPVAGEGASTGTETLPSELGTEVSEMFPAALEKGLLVFVGTNKRYHVARPENQNAALNEKPLTKAEVAQFVAGLPLI